MHAISSKVDLIVKAQGKRIIDEETAISSTNYHERIEECKEDQGEMQNQL